MWAKLTVDPVFHALLSVGQRVHCRSPYKHGPGSQTNGFQYIRAPSDPAIYEDLGLLQNVWSMVLQFEEVK